MDIKIQFQIDVKQKTNTHFVVVELKVTVDKDVKQKIIVENE